MFIKKLKPHKFQDEVLIIRPDFLSDFLLKKIKNRTYKFNSFYFDSIGHRPRKKDIIHFFDHIYSFDKVDIKKYGFEFCTNYIFDEVPFNENYNSLFFNISSNDDEYRFEKLEQLATYIKQRDWSHNFISVRGGKKIIKHDLFTITNKIIPIEEVKDQLLNSKIIVEIQRQNQIGLSFRVFECLGFKRKLITTNKDIVNYDFYNPQNILVLDPENIHIPKSFVESPYVEVSQETLNHYRINNWVKRVFKLNS